MDEAIMDPQIAAELERAKARLLELGVDVVQPPNPYCFTVVLAGTALDPEIVLNFWQGEPESVEFLRSTFPLKMLPRVRAALDKAAGIVEQFPV
jgi:hypothetical protein